MCGCGGSELFNEIIFISAGIAIIALFIVGAVKVNKQAWKELQEKRARKFGDDNQ